VVALRDQLALRKRGVLGALVDVIALRDTSQTAGRRVHLVIVLAALAAMLLIDASTVASLLLDDQGDLKVAVLAPFGAAWLAWNRRDRARGSPIRVWWPGLVVIALTSAAWILGQLAEINLLCHVAFLATSCALVATVLGVAMVRVFAVPLLFLLLAANVFFPLIPLLMQLSAQISVHILQLTNTPAELNGLFIVTPIGHWQVIEGCSGLDYVLIFAMAACLYSSLAFHSTLRKALFVIAAAAAALLANGLRFWGIVYMAYLRDGVETDHSLVGYVVFALVFVLVFAIGYLLGQPPLDRRENQAARSAAATSPVGITVMAAVAALAITGSASASVSVMQEHSRRQTAFDGCRQLGQIIALRDGASVVQARTQCSGPLGTQQLRSIAEQTMKKAAPNAEFSTGTRSIELARGSRIINAATLTTLDGRAVYRLTYWFEVADTATGSWVEMKWNRALALLANRDASVTVVSELETLGNSGSGAQ